MITSQTKNGATSGNATPLRIRSMKETQMLPNGTTSQQPEQENLAELRSKEFQITYAAWNVASSAKHVGEMVDQVDNAVTLMETAKSLDEALEKIAEAKKRIETRVAGIYFPEVA